MARGLLGQLDPRGQPKLCVDVREVCLHGAGRDEQPRGDLFVAQAFANQPDDVEFGAGQRFPAGAGPLAFPAAALRVGDGLSERQCRTLGLCCVKIVLAQHFSQRRYLAFVVSFENLETHHAHAPVGRVRSPEQPRR